MATPKKKKPAKNTQEHRSFKASKEVEPFFALRFTQQTAYWLVLCGIILALGIWVMYLTLKVQNIYDQIDASRPQTGHMIFKHK